MSLFSGVRYTLMAACVVFVLSAVLLWFYSREGQMHIPT